MLLYSVAAISRALGIPESEIRQLTKEDVIHNGVNAGGRYTLDITARELLDYYRRDTEKANYENERALLMRTKRMSAEYDLKLKEQDLHKTEDIELLLTQMLVRFRAKLAALPTKLAPQLCEISDSAEIFDFLKKAIDETQEELADYDGLFQSDGDEVEET